MDALRNRLKMYCELADESWQEFVEMPGQRVTYERDELLVRTGERTDRLFVIIDGWATRFRMVEETRRQITNFMLPGDFFDLQALATVRADHSIRAATKVEVLEFGAADFTNTMLRCAPVATAMWWMAVQEESILREQIVRIGRRTAQERIGHLLLELRRRLQAAYDKPMDTIPLPATRTDLADAVGLTPVHVSRTMSALRQAGLIEETRSHVKFLNREKFSRLAHFRPEYLHFEPKRFSG